MACAWAEEREFFTAQLAQQNTIRRLWSGRAYDAFESARNLTCDFDNRAIVSSAAYDSLLRTNRMGKSISILVEKIMWILVECTIDDGDKPQQVF